MRDSQHEGQVGRGSDELTPLARTVVSRLVASPPLVQRPVDADLVDALARAALARDPAALSRMMPALRQMRIGDIDLIDRYLPAVARTLGCGWAEDRLGFASVTIGMARLQGLLRQVSSELPVQVTSDAAVDMPTVLMVLPETEQHSFGLQVLGGQMRRQGFLLQIVLGQGPDRIADLVRQRSYDMAFVSVGGDAQVACAAAVVKALKTGSGGRLAVAVGGAQLDRCVDLHLAVGADIATCDPARALAFARTRALAQDGHKRWPPRMEASGKRLEAT